MKLLVVEDTEALRDTMATHLREAGFAVDATGDGGEGLWYAQENEYAVVVLDLSLPSKDGLEILEAIRQSGKETSVLIATARDAVENRVEGLNAGADDYLVKPFSLAELLARVRALMRRTFRETQSVLSCGDLKLDTIKRLAYANERLLKLTAMELSLLELLMHRKGQVVRRRDVWEQIYEFDCDSDSNVIEVLIGRLRKKLAACGLKSIIHTRRGEGYVLDGSSR